MSTAIVVGAGIVGASTAFHLTQLGADVCLVDSNAPGRATFAGAGIVCPWLSHSRDPRYEELSFAATRYYPALIAKLAAAGETAVGYDEVGGLVVGHAGDRFDAVIQRLQGYLDRGVKEIGQVRLLDRGGPKGLFHYLDPALAGIYLSGAFRVSGESLRLALLNATLKAGARQVSGAAALERAGNAVIGVRVNDELFRADTVIVAAGAWSADLCRPLGLELGVEPQRGQILHLQVADAHTETLPLIIPVLSDYYLLAFPDSRVVVGATRESGSGFDHRITAGGVSEVLHEGLRIAPGLKTATLAEIRVGFRPMTKDGLPLLGRPSSVPGVVIATGLGRYGLTVGPYAGLLAARLAVEQTPESDVSPFDPGRRTGVV
ncbi:MAG: FAD-binding oxidoreductase [Verrucomicrobia bacterium]|nr:FAD-binding oxidoreductase [Verrucomicrobiota bacterium]